MKSQTSFKIPCPVHPSEFIQRVNIEQYVLKEFYCFECILQNEGASALSNQLKTIPNLLDLAAEKYSQARTSAKYGSKIPAEYLSVISHQAESLEKLNKHIDELKTKTINFFDEFSISLLSLITAKKDRYLQTLDQQLVNLHSWYIHYEKQLKKAYPTEEDASSLFPTREELEGKLVLISHPDEFELFIRNIKEDLNRDWEKDSETSIKKLTQEITRIEKLVPHFKQGEGGLLDFKTQLNGFTEKLLDQNFTLKEEIEEVVSKNNYGSGIATIEDFEVIKQWLPKEMPFKPKLIYRATRDGRAANSFHTQCDGKENTLTLVQAKFSNIDKPFLIGGFFDKPWNSNGNYIPSSNAFLFSVSAKKKCIPHKSEFAGYGHYVQGPTFGAGHDLAVNLNGSDNGFLHETSYVETSHLHPNKESSLQYFKSVEVEVFELTD